MEQYKLLGVDETASMEEIEKAHADRVARIKNEIDDEKRAKSFIRILDKAYEDIKTQRAISADKLLNNDETTVLDETRYMDTSMDTDYSDYKDDDDDEYEDDYEEEDYEEEAPERKKRRSSSSGSSGARGKNKNSSREDKSDNKRSKEKVRKKELNPVLKVIGFPLIAIVSVLLFILKVIRGIAWVASKIIMVAAIGGAAIHGYQIYMGDPIQYKIFAICGGAFLVALILPWLLKILISILNSINKFLKKYMQ